MYPLHSTANFGNCALSVSCDLSESVPLVEGRQSPWPTSWFGGVIETHFLLTLRTPSPLLQISVSSSGYDLFSVFWSISFLLSSSGAVLSVFGLMSMIMSLRGWQPSDHSGLLQLDLSSLLLWPLSLVLISSGECSGLASMESSFLKLLTLNVD